MAVLEAAVMTLPIIVRDLQAYHSLFGDLCLYGTDETFPGLLRGCILDTDLSTDLRRRSDLIALRFDAERRAQALMRLYDTLACRL